MRTRSFLPLLGFIFAIVLLFLSAKLSGFGEFAWGLINPPTALITFGTAYVLYFGSFFKSDKKQKNLMLFRFRWMREVLMLTGLFGAVIGITIMSTFAGSGEAIGVGLSASLVAPLYGFFGAIGFYLLEKHLNESKNHEEMGTFTVKPGINYRSITSIGIIIIMLLMAIGVAVTAASPEPMNIVKLFFSLPIIYFIFAILLASIFIFDGKTVIQAWVVPFIRAGTVLDNTLPTLRVIRGLKRIVSLMGLVAVSATPIVMIATLGSIEEISEMFIPLGKSGAVLFWAMFCLLLLFLAEGQLVQQNYCKTGAIHSDDHFFIIKFVFPSFLIFFFSMWLAFLFQLFA
ncbi:MAG: MotA/TolQ/ExbB proton channel family protein [Candidatus Marinimicrobia bacterium]|nr:MotA/TolQ/ExbB proton channel family protein [candidate division KSB1 bacterium]MBL7046733.1 MotA/TolQ/ExbB proton channel family protein [Candidatus Neomarinimicrobiota bacterium]